MGLLKDLFGKVAGNVIDQIKEAALGNSNSSSRPSSSTTSASQSREQVYSEPQRQKSMAEWRIFFRDILQAEYVGYGLKEDVPVTALVGDVTDSFQLYKTRPRQAYKAEWGQPYTFVLYQNNLPKAVVMLGGGHSHYNNVKYLIARMYAQKLGLPYINFYTQMPNERGYVISRLRKFLR